MPACTFPITLFVPLVEPFTSTSCASRSSKSSGSPIIFASSRFSFSLRTGSNSSMSYIGGHWAFQWSTMRSTSWSLMKQPCTRSGLGCPPGEKSMSPRPSRASAPFWSRIVRESTFCDTWKAMRLGKFALMMPVMTFTEGRWVARIRWMPTARAICASRWIDSSTSALAVIIRSASSSTITPTYGIGSRLLPAAFGKLPGFSAMAL